MTHAERFAKALLHIKAGEYEAALKLYDDKEALASEKRVIQRKVDYAVAANANRSDCGTVRNKI